jgi:fatty acid desaturase
MYCKAIAVLAAAALPLASSFHASGMVQPRMVSTGSMGRVATHNSARFASARRGRVSNVFMTASVAPTASQQTLAPEDQWLANFDHAGFRKEVAELGKRLEKNQGKDDVDHIKKICLWSNMFAAIGLATMWLPPNPITVMALSLWTFSRWTTIAHHTGHGGYNRADETKYFNSRGFATGSLFKRVTEWFDWMLPEAWNIEHNNLHHYRLGEKADPDLVERNLEFTRKLNAPMAVKYAITGFLMMSWKWFYYSPNTYKELKIAEMRKLGKPIGEGADNAFTLKSFVDRYLPGEKPTMWYSFTDLMKNVMGPYLLIHFFLMPLPLLFLGTGAYMNAVVSLFLADIVTNIHSFIVIATNHAGADMYKFESGCAPNSATFFMRQVISSTNFRTGGDVNDFMHGWLNYQIEHHVWPNLSALSYQRGQPELKAICEKYGVPYVQESVWTRLRKTVDIMVGLADQRPFPAHMERQADLKVWPRPHTARRRFPLLVGAVHEHSNRRILSLLDARLHVYV